MDHVLSRAADDIAVNSLEICDFISDHNLVKCKIGINRARPKLRVVISRNFKGISIDKFKSDIKASSLVSDFQHLDLESLVTEYDRVLRAILDKHAPFIKTVKTVKYREPWYNKDIQEARRISRKYERTFRKTPTIKNKTLFQLHRDTYKTKL